VISAAELTAKNAQKWVLCWRSSPGKSSSAIQNGSGAHRRRCGENRFDDYDGSVRAQLDRLRARMISE